MSLTSMVMLAAAALSSDPIDPDKFIWAHGKEGKFRVRDTYCLSRGLTVQVGWEGWRLLWKVKVQDRIKVFLWIMSNKKLLTNLERWKRRMAANPLCGRCYQEDEGVLHAIRDCAVAKEVWKCLIEPKLAPEFFSIGAQRLGSLDVEKWEAELCPIAVDEERGNSVLEAIRVEECRAFQWREAGERPATEASF